MLNQTPKSRALTLMLSSSTTSRSTLLPSKEDVPTELMVINPYMASPCHVEIMLSEHEVAVARAAESGPKKVSQKKLKKAKMMAAQSGGFE